MVTIITRAPRVIQAGAKRQPKIKTRVVACTVCHQVAVAIVNGEVFCKDHK